MGTIFSISQKDLSNYDRMKSPIIGTMEIQDIFSDNNNHRELILLPDEIEFLMSSSNSPNEKADMIVHYLLYYCHVDCNVIYVKYRLTVTTYDNNLRANIIYLNIYNMTKFIIEKSCFFHSIGMISDDRISDFDVIIKKSIFTNL